MGASSFVGTETCIGCHDTGELHITDNVHMRIESFEVRGAEVGCEGCHGDGAQHMEAGGVAIGGVVARAGVILKPESAADTALVDPDHWNAEWVHPVEWKFRAAFPSLPLRGFREFEFRVSHDLVESAWSEYAHGGYMSSGILGKFEDSGPGARFLLLVRVESDDVSQDLISGSTRVSNESGIKNRVGNAQSSLDMEPTFIRIDLVRKVGLTASLFDLEAGACVWEDRVVAESTIRIDPVTIQNMGIRTAPVIRKPVTKTIRTFGNVTYDETGMVSVNTKFDGWIEKLAVTATGDPVNEGQLLFELYSPTLVNAQQEYLTAVRSNNRVLLEASRDRLTALGITDSEIARLRENREASQRVRVYAESDGVIAHLGVREGIFITPATEVMSVAQLDKVWVVAEVFERQSAWVEPGQQAGLCFSRNTELHIQVLVNESRDIHVAGGFQAFEPGRRVYFTDAKTHFLVVQEIEAGHVHVQHPHDLGH